MFNPPPRTSEVYCDITTPARWEGDDTVHLIDLDLDVVRRRAPAWSSCATRTSSPSTGPGSGTRTRWWPQAEAAARRLFGALADTEPFATAYRKWLALVT